MKLTHIRGMLFPSRAEAARFLGIGERSLHRAIKDGRIEFAGTGKNKPKPLTVDGVEYLSIQQASRGTGIPFETLRKRTITSLRNSENSCVVRSCTEPQGDCK